MPERNVSRLEEDARSIWRAGVDAAHPKVLMPQTMQLEGTDLRFGDGVTVDLTAIRRIAVVGAGKASAEMARQLEEILGAKLLREKNVHGFVNVPDDQVGSPLQSIRLVGVREAGNNLPTPRALAGTQKIIRTVEELNEADLCICLLSGGGGPILELPADGVTLEDIVEVTQRMSSRGADIATMNAVRSRISKVKAGGLARRCRAGRLVSLILSDVIDFPLHVVACGPTFTDIAPDERLDVIMAQYNLSQGVRAAVARSLNADQKPATCVVTNQQIGGIDAAVQGALRSAIFLEYEAEATHEFRSGDATDIGRLIAERAKELRRRGRKRCLISGGESTVHVQPNSKGGRNQHLALAAGIGIGDTHGIAIASGGTDGEDGPTDAAGAVISPELMAQARSAGLEPERYLQETNSHPFFQAAGGHIRTGFTGTNVGDLRVVLTDAN